MNIIQFEHTSPYKVRAGQFTRGLMRYIATFTIAMLITPAFASTATKIWDSSQDNNLEMIDHTPWQTILDAYLVTETPSGVHLFNYSAVSDEHQNLLKSYLESMEQVDPRTYPRTEQKAYWINLYNAATVNLILENYPLKSITKLGDSFFAFGPWDDDAVTVAGEVLTLNDIEHKILRPIWRDPRIHYAVNCASFGCPNLASTAYTRQNIEQLLDEGAYAYINHKRGVHFEGKELILSKIYHWYKEDFGNHESHLIQHLIRYAKPELRVKLEQFKTAGDFDIDYEYNWSLNDSTEPE